MRLRFTPLLLCLLTRDEATKAFVVPIHFASSRSPVAQNNLSLDAQTSSPATSTAMATGEGKHFEIKKDTVIPETFPLPENTFAGLVERGMIEKFGQENIHRILQSWRLLEQDYQHYQFVGNIQTPPTENILCTQHAHSFVPGLSAKTFYNVQDFEWCQKLASRYNVIRKEFRRVMSSGPERLQREGNNVWAKPLTQDASSYGEGWSTLVLMNRGIWDRTNAVNLFPETARAIRQAGVPATEIFFASMKPNTDIKLHSDFTNFVVTSHLGIDIPDNGNNKCRLTIGHETKQWKNGHVMMFDTSILHSAVNESDRTRYILMFRLWHPDLTQIERDALQYTYDCLEVPELVVAPNGQITTDAERMEAERRVQEMKAFPKELSNQSGGFSTVRNGGKKKKKNKAKRK